jgi:fatty acid desaturase
MSTRGHRNLLEKLTLGLFGLRIFRSRAVRWPLAALFAGLAVHAATGTPALEGAGRGFAVPAILFLFALFLVLLPLLPLADKWDERR